MKEDRAAGGFHHPGDHLPDGAFAGAVGTEHAQNLARRNGKPNLANGHNRAVTLGKVTNLKDRRRVHRDCGHRRGTKSSWAFVLPGIDFFDDSGTLRFLRGLCHLRALRF